MKKLIIGLCLAFGMSITVPVISVPAEAAPTTQSQSVKKPTVKKPTAKKTTAKKKKTAKKKGIGKKKPRQQQVAARLRQVAAKVEPPKKCQILFWEVECTDHTNSMPESVQHATSPAKLYTADGSKNIRKAQQYVGLHGSKNRQTVKALISKPFDRPVDPARIPWCAAFANAILRENNFGTTDSLMARSFLSYGLSTAKPVEGDIVVLKRGRGNQTGHVGFYVQTVEINGQTYVAVLGGNQGKAVSIAYFPKSTVLGYRRPVVA